MTALPDFSRVRPTTTEEVVGMLDADSVAYAGGTELLLAMRVGLLRPTTLVDLKRVPELSAIEEVDGVLRIGATATHRDVERSPAVRHHLPTVAATAARIGNPRVRATGTVGGNVCFAEPKSDWLPLLVATGATITLQSARGRRTVPVEQFLQGPYWTDRADDELAVHLDLPLDERRVLVYEKFQTMERPTLGVAVAGWRGSQRRRVVIASAVELPHVVEVTEADALDVDSVVGSLDIVADLTGSEEYKRHLAAVHLRRALRALEAELA